MVYVYGVWCMVKISEHRKLNLYRDHAFVPSNERGVRNISSATMKKEKKKMMRL